jgi:hypothetical protein
MDSDDNEIDVPIFDNIEASDGLISFYRKKLGGKHSLDFMRLQYEEFASEETFVVFSNDDDGKYFIIDTENNQPVCNKWVLDYSFGDGVIRLELPNRGKSKFVLWSGIYNEILPECMYDYIGEFSEHVAVVMERGKYSYINDEGERIINQWFDDVDDFNSEYDIVTLNGKKNIFSKEKQNLLMDVWVDEIQSPFEHDALATVWIDNKQNLVTEEGDFLFPDFVDVLGNTKLYNGYEWCVPFCLNR